jgi:hypothetical protein
MNTPQEGNTRYIIFKDKGENAWFGAALDFNIVEERDDPMSIMAPLFDAVQGYVEAAQKEKISGAVLNQTPDQEYKNMWNALIEKNRAHLPKNRSIYNFGYQELQEVNT